MKWQCWFRRLLTFSAFLLLILSILICLPSNYHFNIVPDDFSTAPDGDWRFSSTRQVDVSPQVYKPIDEDDTSLGESKRLPGCIIIGARKCGTRALLEFLNLHPDVSTAKDELHFFNKDSVYAKGFEWYRRRMPSSLPHHVTVEKTPGYFISPAAPARIHRMNESIRLLLIVREPVRRTVSDYTQVHTTKIMKGKQHFPFERMVIDPNTGRIRSNYKPVRNSLYYKHIKEWLKYFPLTSIHIVDGDRFVDDPLSELRKVERFLGLEEKIDSRQLYFNHTKGFYCFRHPREGPQCLGETKGRPHVNISEDVKHKLETFFAPFNRLFFQVTNRTFDWVI